MSLIRASINLHSTEDGPIAWNQSAIWTKSTYQGCSRVLITSLLLIIDVRVISIHRVHLVRICRNPIITGYDPCCGWNPYRLVTTISNDNVLNVPSFQHIFHISWCVMNSISILMLQYAITSFPTILGLLQLQCSVVVGLDFSSHVLFTLVSFYYLYCTRIN